MPAAREDGTDVVLKVQSPHRESENEADALAAWDGAGAVRLLAHDPEMNAILLERCVPGEPLSERPHDEALDVVAKLLPRLLIHVVPGRFRTVGEEASWWASRLRQRWLDSGRPFEERILDAALDILHTLPDTQGGQVLVNQDLHPGNVLAARREPWLVIDPKPLVGEREFALAPVLRSTELGHSRSELYRRLDLLTSELGLDRERARLWCVAQTVAWSIGEGAGPEHIEVARWLLESG